MFIFAHAGITLGAAVLLNGALCRNRIPNTRVNGLKARPEPLSVKPSSNNHHDGITMSWFASLSNRIDIRLLLIGSLLPDIIDKPIGQFFFLNTFSNGRIFSHTLLFLVLISMGGLYLYWRRNKTWLLVLSFGTFTHLVLDLMWLTPRTLLWPLYGFSFERIYLGNWIQDMLHRLLNQPIVVIPELAGAIIIFSFLWVLVRRGGLCAFVRTGQV
jgi:hypothetical protein